MFLVTFGKLKFVNYASEHRVKWTASAWCDAGLVNQTIAKPIQPTHFKTWYINS